MSLHYGDDLMTSPAVTTLGLRPRRDTDAGGGEGLPRLLADGPAIFSSSICKEMYNCK